MCNIYDKVWIIGDDGNPIDTDYGDVIFYLTQGIHLVAYSTYEDCKNKTNPIHI